MPKQLRRNLNDTTNPDYTYGTRYFTRDHAEQLGERRICENPARCSIRMNSRWE